MFGQNKEQTQLEVLTEDSPEPCGTQRTRGGGDDLTSLRVGAPCGCLTQRHISVIAITI